MKKLLFSAVLMLAVISVQAQASAQVGLKGGLNVTNLSSDADATYESRTGFHAGLYGLIKFANIGVQPELLYSVQGTEVDFDQSGNFRDQDYYYMNIPVLLKFYFVGGLNIHAGPQFGILLGADGTYQDDAGVQRDLDRDALKNSDISGALGVGWDAPFGLNLTARYVLGFSDINDQSSIEAKNRIFQLSAGFRLFKAGR